jgi:Uma2 family endonuclease
LRHGGKLGWLIAPEDRVVLVYRPDCLPDELTGDAQLLGLPDMNWGLTVEQLFGWLKVGVP